MRKRATITISALAWVIVLFSLPASAAKMESVFVGVGYGKPMNMAGFNDKGLVYRASMFAKGAEIGVLDGEFDSTDMAANAGGKARYTVIFMSQPGTGRRNWRLNYGYGYVMERVKTQAPGAAAVTSKHNTWALSAGVKYMIQEKKNTRDKFMIALECFYFLNKAAAKGLVSLTFNIAFNQK